MVGLMGPYTYLVIGYDPERHNFTHDECGNILSYIHTRFFGFMVSIKKKTQNTTRDLFQFVPSKTGPNLGLTPNSTRNTTSPKKRSTT